MESPMYADVLADTGIDPEQVMARQRPDYDAIMAAWFEEAEQMLAQEITHEEPEDGEPDSDQEIEDATSGWRG